MATWFQFRPCPRSTLAFRLAAGALALAPSAAGAAATCGYDAATHRLAVATDADGQDPAVACTGGAPMVENTNRSSSPTAGCETAG